MLAVKLKEAACEAVLGIEAVLGLKKRVDVRVGVTEVLKFDVASVSEIEAPSELEGKASQALNERFGSCAALW